MVRFPGHELYSYTVSDRVWADQEWGSEVLGDLIFRGGGFLAFSLAYVAITWAGFWFIWRRIGLERVPALIAGACIAVAAAAGVEVWGSRSQMISFALTCLTLYWVESYLRDRNRHLYLLPLVTLVWANFHGGFVYGLAVLGLAGHHRDRPLAGLTAGWGPSPALAPALGGARGVRGGGPDQPADLPRLPGRHRDPDQRCPADLHRRVALPELPLAGRARTRAAPPAGGLRHGRAPAPAMGRAAHRGGRLRGPLRGAQRPAGRRRPDPDGGLVPGRGVERSRWRDRVAAWIQRRSSDLLILVSAGALIVSVAWSGSRPTP